MEDSQVPSLSSSSAAKKTITHTAMNEFSMDRAPLSRRVSNIENKSALKVVLEDEIMEEEECRNDAGQLAPQMMLNSMSSLLNDFLVEDSTNYHSKSSMNFDFGVYLEYWRPNRRNYVIPHYRTLKDELTKNIYHRMSEQQFNELRQKCEGLKCGYKAGDIGRGNEICHIPAGSSITIAHLMAMKVYTDFDDLQREFKRHCRRLRKGESVKSVMERNQEIANWCRLLTECIMFWGDTMAKKQEFYCGLTARLVLRSLNQRFECPLSTTRSWDIAQRFTGDHQGIILKIKRGNARTRYFDVASISAHSEEEESLFVGSTIKITGIFAFNEVRRKWESLKPKFFVSALAMFEQIYNGHFIDGKNAVRNLLLKLIGLVNDDAGTKSM